MTNPRQPPHGPTDGATGTPRATTASSSGWNEPTTRREPPTSASASASPPPHQSIITTPADNADAPAFVPPDWSTRNVLVGVLAMVLLIVGILAASAAPYRGDLTSDADFATYEAVDWLIVVALVVLACNVAVFAWLALRFTSGTGPHMMAVTAATMVVVAIAPLILQEGIGANFAELAVPALAMYGLGVYVAMLVAANRDPLRDAISRLGLTIPKQRRAYLEAAGIYGGAFVALTIWGLLTEVSGAPEWTQIPDNASDIIDDYGVITTLFVVIILAPIGEEVVFRGFAYAGLTNRLGIIGAAVATSLVFAVIHLDPSNDVGIGIIPPTFILGIALVAIYHRTGSLTLAIGAHALHNGIAVAALSVT